MLTNIDFCEIINVLKNQIENKLLKEPFLIFICNNFLPKSILKKLLDPQRPAGCLRT